MKLKLSLFLIVCLIGGKSLFAQLNEPINFNYTHELNRYLDQRNSNFHTAVKPYARIEVDSIISKDSIYNFKEFNGYFNSLANGDLLSVDSENFSLTLNPLFDLSFGYDVNQNSTIYQAAIGAQINASFWRKLGVGFSYQKHFTDPFSYAKDRILREKIIPGSGKLQDSIGNLSAQIFEGYVNFTPNKFFSMEGGFGKHFWGDGYRSFFISDNATSYPYVELTANFWRIKYVYLFTVMKSADLEPKGKFPNEFEFNVEDTQTKYGVYHYLSIDAAKWMQFGFFEGVVWKREDSTGIRGIEWNYLNPVVFLRPVEFAIGSPDNVILGLNFKFKLGDKNSIYTQLILDDLDIGSARKGSGFYRTKVAWQIGYKSYDLFKLDHLDFQTEFNLVRPYVFAHKSKEQNYAHLSQSLTHPLGANFWEWLVFINYRKDRWMASFNLQWVKQGGDVLDNVNADHQGSNIHLSDFDIDNLIGGDLDTGFDNEFLQGQLNDITNITISGGFLLNPKLNMSIQAFIQHRVRSIPELDFKEKNTGFGISFKTDLFNSYFDY